MPYNVLFLCTGNSARSILAESLLNHWGHGRFRGFSAGSFPTGRVNPHATALLERLRIPASDARSKSWDEFAVPGAPELDFVITICDNAAGEVCPIWPGRPVTAHWGVEDPAAVTGSEAEVTSAFASAERRLRRRVERFLALPPEILNTPEVRVLLEAIGRDATP